MARRVPAGQLALFEDLPKAPPPPAVAEAILKASDDDPAAAPAAPVELFSPEVVIALESQPAEPARLALVIPVSGKSGGAVAAAARQLDLAAEALLSLAIHVLDFGPFDSVEAEEMDAIIEACRSLEMRRFEAVLTALGSRDDGVPALLADDSALFAFADALRGALREHGAPSGETDGNGPHLPLRSDTTLAGQISLDRPLRLPVRDFALVRLLVDGGYDVQHKWTLAL